MLCCTLDLLWWGGFTEDTLFKLLFKVVFNNELSPNPHRQVAGAHPLLDPFILDCFVALSLWPFFLLRHSEDLCAHIPCDQQYNVFLFRRGGVSFWSLWRCGGPELPFTFMVCTFSFNCRRRSRIIVCCDVLLFRTALIAGALTAYEESFATLVSAMA